MAAGKTPHDRVRVDPQKHQRVFWKGLHSSFHPLPERSAENQPGKRAESKIPENTNIVVAANDEQLCFRFQSGSLAEFQQPFLSCRDFPWVVHQVSREHQEIGLFPEQRITEMNRDVVVAAFPVDIGNVCDLDAHRSQRTNRLKKFKRGKVSLAYILCVSNGKREILAVVPTASPHWPLAIAQCLPYESIFARGVPRSADNTTPLKNNGRVSMLRRAITPYRSASAAERGQVGKPALFCRRMAIPMLWRDWSRIGSRGKEQNKAYGAYASPRLPHRA